MKHYTCSWAPNPYKVRLAFAELEIPAEHVEMDARNRENRRPAFLQVNPNGRLPVVDDGGFVLWESNAILAYLAKKFPEKKLWPEDGRGEADALRWLFYETSTLQPPIAEVWWARWLTPRLGAGIPPAVPEPSPAGIEERGGAERRGGSPLGGRTADQGRIERPLNVLNEHIRTREWVLDAFSVVDCALAAPLLMMELSNVPMDRWAGVASYWRRWKTRASFAATPFRYPGE